MTKKWKKFWYYLTWAAIILMAILLIYAIITKL